MGYFPTIKEAEDSRRTWRGVNALAAALDPHKREIDRLNSAVADLRTRLGWRPQAGTGGGTADIKVVLVTEERADVLRVKELVGMSTGYTTVDPEFMVAKPWHLRRASNVTDEWNGLPVSGASYPAAYRRDLTLGSPYPGVVVHQTLAPYRYGITSWLIAYRTLKQNVVEPEQPAEGVLWVDLNIDARHWQTDYALVNVCVAGVGKQMLIQGSTPF